jgi:23S rRNA (uracil1939-C5)-methyltransferase
MRKKNVLLERVQVTDYAAEGQALAKIDGKVIFIEGAVPGDIVDVQITKNKKDWATGKAINIHTYSPQRVPAFCHHFGTCGGCKWQMLPYEKQLAFKQNEVEQHLKRIGKLELPAMEPIVGADKTRYYRNKLEFTFSNKKWLTKEEIEQAPPNTLVQTPALGFHVPKIFDKIIDIEHCHLMEEPANAIKNTIRQYAFQHQIPFYDIKQHTGWLRNLMIRLTTTGEVMVNLVIGYADEKTLQGLFEHLRAAVPQITTLLYTVNPKWNDSIYDLNPVVYRGKGFVIEQLESFQFKIGPKSFFQTNTRQGEALYQVTRKFAALTGKEVVYDLYCGTGSIGIFVSPHAAKIIGVETVAEAVADAHENAVMNGIQHASFFAGDVIDICTDAFFAEHGKPDVIITDPPRAGMHTKLIDKLLEIRAPRLVYVSCNPATQARDLALLNEAYAVTAIQPVDMFPHTHHIENVVQLTLRENG